MIKLQRFKCPIRITPYHAIFMFYPRQSVTLLTVRLFLKISYHLIFNICIFVNCIQESPVFQLSVAKTESVYHLYKLF